MPVDPLSLALIGGGSAINAIGGLLGGASANRAGREARDFADRDLLGGQGNMAVQIYGDQAAYIPTLRRLLGEAQQRNNPQQAYEIAQQISAGMRPTSNSLLGRMESTGQDIIRLQNDDLAGFDAESSRLEGMMTGAADRQRGEGNRLNRLAGGAESMATSAGVGRERIIRRDAAKRNKAMDQQTRASLAGSGFANTTAAPAAMAANAQSVAEAQDRALQDAQDSRLASLLMARENRIRTGQQVAGANYNADTNVVQTAAQRNQQRTGLRAAQLANEQSLRYLPMQTQLGVEQGSIMNPHQGMNTAQYYPGASGGGNALASVGSSLTGAGGLMLATRQTPPPTPQQVRTFDDTSEYFARWGPGGYGGIG